MIATALASSTAKTGPCVMRSSEGSNLGNGELACGLDIQPCSAGDPRLCEVVPSATLDSVLLGLSPPVSNIDIVKMDVEGSECAVLAGSHLLFQQYRPSLIEMEVKGAASRRCGYAVAAQHNYTVHELHTRDRDILLVRGDIG